MRMDKNTIIGSDPFCTDTIQPRSVVLNYADKTGFLSYSKEGGKKSTITRSFNDIFNSVNAHILSSQSNMILPTGCIFTSKMSSEKEVFLMQEQPGIRTFRLSNTSRVIDLVSKMHSKFKAQTRVLELNEVLPESQAKVKKEIALRNQYIDQQKLIKNDNGKTYKYNFRVYFPYTYIMIRINTVKNRNKKDRLGFAQMKAGISVDPINTFNDYLYQFPLSNVSTDGGVCTGNLSLGDYGLINIKSYVEKMTGYFWNNRFNADITSGPELYGDVNFLGNWFEWEYISYTNPSEVLTLSLKEPSIIEKRHSVGHFVFYENGRSNNKSPIYTVNEHTIVDGFESINSFSDSAVDLQDGKAKKNITGISESINIEGHDIAVKSLIKTKKKKFKIISFDGYKTYDISDSTITEKAMFVTHVRLKDEKKRIHKFILGDKGSEFLIDAFRLSRNYIAEAKFKDVTYTTGELVAYKYEETMRSHSNPDIQIIKSIREQNNNYIFSFYAHESVTLPKCEDPAIIQKVDINFQLNIQEDGSPTFLKNLDKFSYRTKKMLRGERIPSPYSIKDHLSSPLTGSLEVGRTEFKQKKKQSKNYGYTNNTDMIHINYIIRKDGLDNEDFCDPLDSFILETNDDKIKLIIPLPNYIVGVGSIEGSEITPKINGSETVIVGHQVFQAITNLEGGEDVPFKIMRDGTDTAKISTTRDHATVQDHMFFKPALHHLQSCIEDIDGVKTFTVRDLFEADTENEYIHFRVGDEVMLASDWDPKNDVGPSIKKIYDFMTLEDKYNHVHMETSRNRDNDSLLSHVPVEDEPLIMHKYNLYQKSPLSVEGESDEILNGLRVDESLGTLYAVIDNGCDELILYPLLDGTGQHFLNGISHVSKEIENLKSGDFVKPDIGGIPYFAKKNVYEVVGSVKINNRYLTIMSDGLTMWTDIILKNFKIFKRDKLTEKKLDFYKEKASVPDMPHFMVIYGDMYFTQIALPIYSKDNFPFSVNSNLRDNNYERMKKGEMSNTLNLLKSEYESLKETNGNTDFKTISGFTVLNNQLIKLDHQCASFRSMYDGNNIVGSLITNTHISVATPTWKFFDVCYSMNNSSMTNGSAYMHMKACFTGPMNKYYYYSGPYSKNKSWNIESATRIAMSTFPTPRILKKSTREVNSFITYKHLGPQNIYYSFMMINKSNPTPRYHRNNENMSYSITNDKMFINDET